ncbi:MAG: hypothetical protein WAO55_03025 [Candidatus Manganitrophaceae bacterium]
MSGSTVLVAINALLLKWTGLKGIGNRVRLEPERSLSVGRGGAGRG